MGVDSLDSIYGNVEKKINIDTEKGMKLVR
jgi:hypothetical protein